MPSVFAFPPCMVCLLEWWRFGAGRRFFPGEKAAKFSVIGENPMYCVKRNRTYRDEIPVNRLGRGVFPDKSAVVR